MMKQLLLLDELTTDVVSVMNNLVSFVENLSLILVLKFNVSISGS